MTDIYARILGTDAGDRLREAEAKQIIDLAAEAGVRSIVAGPRGAVRTREEAEAVQAQSRKLETYAKERGVHLRRGLAVSLERLLGRSPDMAERYCVKGTRMLLVTLPKGVWPETWKGTLKALCDSGLKVVILLAEANVAIQQDVGLLDELAELGCHFGVDAAALQESDGQQTTAARHILDMGYPYYTASNAENVEEYRRFLQVLEQLEGNIPVRRFRPEKGGESEDAAQGGAAASVETEALETAPEAAEEPVPEQGIGLAVAAGEAAALPDGEAPRRKPSKLRRILAWSVIFLVVVALVSGGIYVYQALQSPARLFQTAGKKIQATQKPMVDWLPGMEGEDADPEETLRTDDGIINILLLGIDQDNKSYAKDGGDYHTDAIINVAVNFEENKVDLISLPRDTFTHVPGIRGIYKLNAAINCGGGKTEAGFAKVCEAASWMLDGEEIDYYAAFDLETVIAIGDLIGGVDFAVDMAYRGNSGTLYEKGIQHLDGAGIYDYMRARRNADPNYATAGDAGRMERCRKMLIAVFNKLKQENMLKMLPELVSEVNKGLYTNLTLQQMLALANFAMGIDLETIGSHTMGGEIRNALEWNFCFIDQVARIQLIGEVYGREAKELQRVSLEYAKWMEHYGFRAVRYMATAREVYGCATEAGTLTAEQKAAYEALAESYTALQAAYEAASLSLGSEDTAKMRTLREELKVRTKALAVLVEYPEPLVWTIKKHWYQDECINEVMVDFN